MSMNLRGMASSYLSGMVDFDLYNSTESLGFRVVILVPTLQNVDCRQCYYVMLRITSGSVPVFSIIHSKRDNNLHNRAQNNNNES